MSPARDPIKFGTSGWRARIGETYTFANVRRLHTLVAIRDAAARHFFA